MKKVTLLCFSVVALLSFGCQSPSSAAPVAGPVPVPGPPPGPVVSTDPGSHIYALVRQVDAVTNNLTWSIWHAGKFSPLGLGGLAGTVQATRMAFDGSSTYALGSIGSKHVVWVNGVPTALPNNGVLYMNIAASGGHWKVAEQSGGYPAYLYVCDDTLKETPYPDPALGVPQEGAISSVWMQNGHLYAAGTQPGATAKVTNATIWTDLVPSVWGTSASAGMARVVGDGTDLWALGTQGTNGTPLSVWKNGKIVATAPAGSSIPGSAGAVLAASQGHFAYLYNDPAVGPAVCAVDGVVQTNPADLQNEFVVGLVGTDVYRGGQNTSGDLGVWALSTWVPFTGTDTLEDMIVQ